VDNLNFEDFEDESLENSLSFDDYSDGELDTAINEISSSLCFELPDNPLVEDISASSKLLGIFEQRLVEIEKALENHRLSKESRQELRLELRMSKTAFAQHKRK